MLTFIYFYNLLALLTIKIMPKIVQKIDPDFEFASG